MSRTGVTGIYSADLGVPDLKRSRSFYTDAWRLTIARETGSSVHLRGSGTHPYILGLHRHPHIAVLRISLSAQDRAAVDAIYARVCTTTSSKIDEPVLADGAYGFSFVDLEGRTLRIVADQLRHADSSSDPDQPIKISHIVLNTTDRDRLADYYCAILGLRIVDRTKFMSFLSAGDDHHCIAIAQHTVCTLNHIAFETPTIDAVMRGVGRLRENGVAVEWGVGRHGPGNNVFAYFLGPDGEIIEYTTDVLKIDDSYKIGAPEDWVWPPGRTDRWGIMPGPSPAYKAAQDRIPFEQGNLAEPTHTTPISVAEAS